VYKDACLSDLSAEDIVDAISMKHRELFVGRFSENQLDLMMQEGEDTKLVGIILNVRTDPPRKNHWLGVKRIEDGSYVFLDSYGEGGPEKLESLDILFYFGENIIWPAVIISKSRFSEIVTRPRSLNPRGGAPIGSHI